MAIKKVKIINGPNLNLLGSRDKNIYGSTTLADIEKESKKHASSLKLDVTFFQSNSESEIIDEIQKSIGKYAAIIINAAAYTHTSIAIRDALDCFKCPIIEVHLSNIHKRESYRHKSFVSEVATGSIIGLGSEGYLLALTAVSKLLK